MLRLLLASAAAAFSVSHAEVVSTSATGFRLQHEATSPLAPDALWARLMEPATWWDGDHSYSGDAANLSLGDKAGDYWREDWAEGSVIHGQILVVKSGEELLLSAPFGPLVETGAACVWKIQIQPSEDGGTVITSTHLIAGSPGTGLEELAGPVDFVMSNGINRLAAAPE